MHRSMLAEHQQNLREEREWRSRMAIEERERTVRFLRFLLKELQTCRTEAEREVILPAVAAARRLIHGEAAVSGPPERALRP